MKSEELGDAMILLIRDHPRALRLSTIRAWFQDEDIDTIETLLWTMMLRNEIRLCPDSTFEAL